MKTLNDNAPAELPDFSRLPEMAPTRMNLLESKQNDLAYRLETLEAFLDFDPKAPASDGFPDDIHGLIAEGMTDVTADMHGHVAREVTTQLTELSSRLVEQTKSSTEIFKSVTESFAGMSANVRCAQTSAALALARIEVLTVRIDAWEQRLEALETKAPR